MLHEVLLALSGHPSPLFDHDAGTFPLTTPAERALLESIGHLASLHRALKSHLVRITSQHRSLICRAAANAIKTQHLARFQKAILDVEDRVLKKKSSVVGAYNIVPLATVVSSFDEWRRSLEWYWSIASYMYPPDKIQQPSTELKGCTGADLINRLAKDLRTGYPDIEKVATELLVTTQRAWLRQLSLWLLKGHTVSGSCPDLFIRCKDSNAISPVFYIHHALQPSFVTDEAASSILFVGKALAHLSESSAPTRFDVKDGAGRSAIQTEWQSVGHLSHLSAIELPISSAKFSGAVADIRSDLCQRLVTEVMPTSQIMRALSFIREFFLAGKGDFIDALVNESDKHIRSRHMQIKSTAELKGGSSLAGVIMKESEIQSILSRVWLNLAPLVDKDENDETDLEWARENLKLGLMKTSEETEEIVDSEDSLRSLAHRIPYVFNDLLLSSPATLSIPIKSPLDLFLTMSDLQIYGSVNAYLTAIRRAHLHLTSLWKITPMRKPHPAPLGPPQSNSQWGQNTLKEGRVKQSKRADSMRLIWSSGSSAVSILSEIGEYFTKEVIAKSWETFRSWADNSQPAQNAGSSLSTSDMQQAADPVRNTASQFGDSQRSATGLDDTGLPRDPEILSQGHRQFLEAITRSLLLDHASFPHVLKSMLVHIDQIVALVLRLEGIQKNIDLQDEGVLDGGRRNYAEEEKDVINQLTIAVQSLDSDIKKLMSTLREINDKRWTPTTLRQSRKQTGFEPWVAVGIDRLILRLDARVVGEEAGD